MYKISGEVIRLIDNTLENSRDELTVGGKSTAEVKIQEEILQGDALSLLSFVIAMMPFNHILIVIRKCTDGCKLHKLQEKINHLMYIDDINLFVKNEKELEILIQVVSIYSDGYRDGIWHREMCHANNEKQKMANDGRNKTTKSRKKIRTLREKKTYKYLEILEVDTIKQVEMKKN